jgi:hypothetical protein
LSPSQPSPSPEQLQSTSGSRSRQELELTPRPEVLLLCWDVVNCDPLALVGHLLYLKGASKPPKRPAQLTRAREGWWVGCSARDHALRAITKVTHARRTTYPDSRDHSLATTSPSLWTTFSLRNLEKKWTDQM